MDGSLSHQRGKGELLPGHSLGSNRGQPPLAVRGEGMTRGMMEAGGVFRGAEEDTAEFIRTLEISAHKILKDANKRRMYEMKQAKMKGRKRPLSAKGPGTYLVDAPHEQGLMSCSLKLSPAAMKVSVKGGQKLTKRDSGLLRSSSATALAPLHDTAVLAYSDGMAGMDDHGTMKLSSTTRKLPKISRVSNANASKVASEEADKKAAAIVHAATTKIHERLLDSPLQNSSMGRTTKRLKQAAQKQDDPNPRESEVGGGISSMRVVTATKVLGLSKNAKQLETRRSSKSAGMHGSSAGRGQGVRKRTESQGLTSWSSDDLRVKYRAEREREEAYEAYLVAAEAAEAVEREHGEVIAVAHVERHPIHVLCQTQLERENARCLLRASARNKMKRFILDVHTVWLTNIGHLAEHRGTGQGPERGRGLEGRRDTEAIRSVSSQIQSVKNEKAFELVMEGTGVPVNKLTEEELELALSAASKYSSLDEHLSPPTLPARPAAVPHLAVLAREVVFGVAVAAGELAAEDSLKAVNVRVQRFAPADQDNADNAGNAVVTGVRWAVSAFTSLTGKEQGITLDDQQALAVARRALRGGRLGVNPALAFRKAQRLPTYQQNGPSPSDLDRALVLCVVEAHVSGGNLPGEVFIDINCFPMRGVRRQRGRRRVLLTGGMAWARLRMSGRVPEEAWWRGDSQEVQELWGLLFQELALGEDEEAEEKEEGGEGVVLFKPLGGVEATEGARHMEWESLAASLLVMVSIAETSNEANPLAIDLAGEVDGLHTKQEVPGDLWWDEADRDLPLTVRVGGRSGRMQQVPGLSLIGKPGLDFTYEQDYKERTQAAADFFRDPAVSSTDGVLVKVILALDTPVLNPTIIATEDASRTPPTVPHEDLPLAIPKGMAELRRELEPVTSTLDVRTAPTALVLNTVEAEKDYKYSDSAVEREAVRRGVKHRRELLPIDALLFRHTAFSRVLAPDAALAPLAFGVTKRAAIGNSTGVNGRSTFHSDQRCIEQLCRQRSTTDYQYISHNTDSRGPNDPNSYNVTCEHVKFKLMWRTGLQNYLAAMEKLKKDKEAAEKQAALEAKIEAGKFLLQRRREREEENARQLALKENRRKEHATGTGLKKRHKWQLRLENSQVMDVRGTWECRRDTGGAVFYHCTDEFVPEPFSWDPPASWEEVTEESNMMAPASGTGTSTGTGTGTSDETPSAAFSASSEPAPITSEQIVEEAVGKLAEHPALLEKLAWRLGIPIEDVRPAGREPPLQRGDEVDDSEASSVHGQVEVASDDDLYSDSEDEAGHRTDLADAGELPQDHTDVRRMRIAARKAKMVEEAERSHKAAHPASVPGLDLEGVAPAPSLKSIESGEWEGSLEAHLKGEGWRRLSKDTLPKNFLEKVTRAHIRGPLPEVVNTAPKPRTIGMIDPTTATVKVERFEIPPVDMFVKDILAEHAKVMMAAEKRMMREEIMEDDTSLDVAQMIADGPQELTSTERQLLALAERDDRPHDVIAQEQASEKALIATKAGNLETLEQALADGCNPDYKDSSGNTLLLLAVQQGNKRIVKFLLRRGATMNAQNMDGNGALHFAMALGHKGLADYLLSKGADDSMLNSQKLTCYEGLESGKVDAL